jgi:hypothetical protein
VLVGETRVDLLHLLEDIADAYPGDPEETILTEIVANSLDSRASHIAITTDAATGSVTFVDDGVGMRRVDLRRFHNIASTSKTRGAGIGFAGVGIKLGLLVCDEVITETCRGKDHLATTWALVGRQRAPWRWIPPLGLVAERGTGVRLRLRNPLSPLLDAGYLESALRRHFEPLLDESLASILAEHYPRGVRFVVDGRELASTTANGRDGLYAQLSLRIARRRKPSAFGFVVREALPSGEDRRGIAVSTYGKVIKRGWDWLGITPLAPDMVRGLVEVPALAATLTLNKADFIRSGVRGSTYLAYRKALQQAVSEQLAAWGDQRPTEEPTRRRATRPVERDLERVLFDLSRDYPLLEALVERRPGGNRKLRVGRDTDGATGFLPLGIAPDLELSAEPREASGKPASPESVDAPVEANTAPAGVAEVSASRGPKRPTRLGLSIDFESRPGDDELGRLVESTVRVNDAHPAYRRAVASRAEGYHLALTVAMALATVAVESDRQREFVAQFLARWGKAVGASTARRHGHKERRRVTS